MKKITVLLLTVCIVISALNINVFALGAENYVSSRTYSESSNGITASGNIPVIKNLSNTVFQQKLNSSIEELYKAKLSEAPSKKIQSLKFEYNAILSGTTLSIVVYSINTKTSASEAASFVIDVSKCTNVYMSSVLGANAIAYANKVFDAKIKAQKTVRYFNLSEITNSNAFYINNSNVYLVFGAGEISAVSKGVAIFEIPSSKITNAIVPASSCYTKSLYNVKMVPLRAALSQFGYSLAFNGSTNTITVAKGTFSTKITVGRNSYYKGKQTPRQLEFAPEIVNGTTYVPISFFNEILDMLFYVDVFGNVTLSRYDV